MNSSLKVALGQRGRARAGDPAPSGSHADLEIVMGSDGIPRPVDVARLLTALDVPLDQAHAMLEKIAAGERLHISVETARIDDARRRFSTLGVVSRRLSRANSRTA